jgi:quercetin dioxygenase-like cupin family protein
VGVPGFTYSVPRIVGKENHSWAWTDTIVGVQHFDLNDVSVEPHQPEVLHSEGEGRTILIQLPAGESLQDHEVHERAWLVVVDGEIEVDAGGGTVSGGRGFLAVFDPKERHEVRARSSSRLLLLLAPWPGEGHPSQPGR